MCGFHLPDLDAGESSRAPESIGIFVVSSVSTAIMTASIVISKQDIYIIPRSYLGLIEFDPILDITLMLFNRPMKRKAADDRHGSEPGVGAIVDEGTNT
jgi:hypothetical protein